MDDRAPENRLRFRRIAAILLAAGLSKRMGGPNKLLIEVEGRPVARRVADALAGAGVDCVFAALGRDADRVGACLEGAPRTRWALNPKFAEGMGTSLAFAASQLDASDWDGILVCLGDLPWLLASDVERVCEAFVEEGCERVVAPVCAGLRGHPVCFPARLLPELRALAGDQGARGIALRDGVLEVASVSSGCIRDLDTLD